MTLEEACQTGNLEVVERGLRAGADINATNEHGHTLLDTACVWGQLAMVRLFIAQGAELGDSLMLAVQSRQMEVVEYLIEHGADVNKGIGKRRDTPLMHAAAYGWTALVRLLLQHGANVNAKNKYGQTALRRATWADHADVIAILKQAGAR